MYIQYDGEIEDEDITDIIEKVLERLELEENKKEISGQIMEALEDFFSDSSD